MPKPEPLSDDEIERRFCPLFDRFSAAIQADLGLVAEIVESANALDRNREVRRIGAAKAVATREANREAKRVERERRRRRTEYQRTYQRDYQRRRRAEIAADPDLRERELARQREYGRRYRQRRISADT